MPMPWQQEQQFFIVRNQTLQMRKMQID
jgi:hypothetical protein